MPSSFTAAGTYTGAALIEQTYGDAIIEGLFKNSEVLSPFGPYRPSDGGTAEGLIFHTGANESVQLFDENDSDPDPDSQEWVKHTVSYNHYKAVTRATGHARAAMKSAYAPGIELNMSLMYDDLMDFVNTTTLSAANNGLGVAIDSTSTYGDITRGSVPYAESKETNVNGIIGYDDLQDWIEALADAEYASDLDEIWMPWNQLTRVYKIGGMPGLKGIGDNDPAPSYMNQTFNGIPIRPIRNMTTTEIFGINKKGRNIENVLHEGFRVEEDRSGDSRIYIITFRFLTVVRNPRKQGKLTGCTA